MVTICDPSASPAGQAPHTAPITKEVVIFQFGSPPFVQITSF